MAAGENAKRIRVPSRHPFDRAAFSVRWRSDTLGLLQRQDVCTQLIPYRDPNATSREVRLRKPPWSDFTMRGMQPRLDLLQPESSRT